MERLRDLRLSWGFCQYSRLTDAEFRSLANEVASDPASRKRVWFESEQTNREMFGGRELIEYELWWGDWKNWRINSTMPDRRSPAARKAGFSDFSDASSTSHSIWSLDDKTLTIASDQKSEVSAGIQSVLSPVRDCFDAAFDAYLSSYLVSAQASELRFENGSWSFTVTTSFVTAHYWFHWSDAAGSFLIDRLTYEKHPDPFKTRLTWTFSDWTPVPNEQEQFIAGKVVASRLDGSEFLSIKNIVAKPLVKEEFDRVVATPDPLGRDAIRGEISARAVFDYRSQIAKAKTKNGSFVDVGTITDKSTRSSILRMTGWFVLGALVFGFVFVRFRVANRSS
jgi:hypothetical protein